MPNSYIMNKEQWMSEVIELLPDVFTKSEHGSKDDVAFDLSLEYGIISGLVPSGWYPDEALDIFINKEYDKGNIEESDVKEFEAKVESYHNNKIAANKN